ncbi:Atp4p [Rhizophagus irregularis DAOM 197198w]|uniref:ATP synthase subunit 4 n=1 Tax=Rhizophagus irregularis (strain DAOM 197198w) TaxID=1432141 RepID=A0A015M3Q5_RHIIW|nr:Atp4p [Rhizophagus irregularis DAOM 197198w]
MAFRLIRNPRGLSAATLRPLQISQRNVAFSGIRRYTASSKDDKQKVEPKQKALSIIDSLPGNSLITKTGYITVGTGLVTLAISKELYVFNEETLLVVSFASIAAVLYRALKKPVNEWAEEQKGRVNNILRKARDDHKNAVQERIETVGQLGDIVDTTKALFSMSKEIASLEAEAFELKQKVAAATEVKAVLDSWVRYESSLREREQKALSDYVIERVKKQLEDPKTQQEILNQSIGDLEIIRA